MSRIKTILVPQGAEYRSVCRGLRQIKHPPRVVAVPLGPKGVKTRLMQESKLGPTLMVGLGGGLRPQYRVGDVVIYRDCVDSLTGKERRQRCDRTLTDHLVQQLPGAILGRGFTSERVITVPPEKQQLHRRFAADVVDMEGAAILAALSAQPVAMIRVISDDCRQRLPNLEAALASDGRLRPWPLTLACLGHPLAAGRLIRGSLTGLAVLQRLMTHVVRD
ncbi:Futalosine hydrolase [Halomicronema hongdechloris C2206]|uniref:Futalosine hydrolase n=1 Tax=Halomicronema hongdechloris C2206 TaxID=1641165 RepID=A0A1Z3HSA9_9CYAN|nr:phosphorylase [Halomicronema hongdechloris]ASC73200.1 Futalosine hydrolase [Halomicronema hongdechloris C2206]